MAMRKVLVPIGKGLALAGKCALCCICLPCLCVFFGSRSRCRKPPFYWTLQDPKPLPRRRRALSRSPERRKSEKPREVLNLPPPTQKRAIEHNDTQPALLTRLPLELRLRIYEYVIGEQTLEIAHMKKSRRLRGERTPTVDLDRCHPHWDCNQHHYVCDVPGPEPPPPSPNPLLRTCRQTYREAIALLYRRTTFELRQQEILPHLLARTFHRRHASLQTLRVWLPGVGADNTAARWAPFWTTVAVHFPNLRHVQLVVFPQVAWTNPDWLDGLEPVFNAVKPVLKMVKRGELRAETFRVRLFRCAECVGDEVEGGLDRFERKTEGMFAERRRWWLLTERIERGGGTEKEREEDERRRREMKSVDSW